MALRDDGTRAGVGGAGVAMAMAVALALAGCSQGGSLATASDAAADAGEPTVGDPDGTRSDGSGAGGSAAGMGGSGVGGAAGCAAPPAPTGEARVHAGDLTITDAAGAEAARSLTEVTGTLRVAPPLAGTLELPNLQAIGGDLRVEEVTVSPGSSAGYPLISHLRLVNLTRIGGALWIYLATALVETDLRGLASVGGDVFVHRNLKLRTVGLDSLHDVGSTVHFSANLLARCEVDAIVAALESGTFNGLGGDRDCACETTCGHVVPSCP